MQLNKVGSGSQVRRHPPKIEGSIATLSVLGCGDDVTARVERTVDGGVDRQEALSGSWRSKFLHLSFSSPNGNVSTFNPVVLPLGLVVPTGQAKVMKRSRVSAPSVGYERPRSKTLLLE
jgi:hypothetical protein